MKAQDIHFSQFYEPHLTLNPANTGYFLGDYRVNGIYRSQWRSVVKPFVTTGLSYDQHINFLGESIGLGGYYFYDQSGDGKLTMHKFMISAAYHKNLGGHIFSLGTQVGLVNKGIDYSALSFPDQYDNTKGGFNIALANNELILDESTSYLDLNAGLTWAKRINDKLVMQAGYALFHLTTPKESLLQQENQLPIRHVFSIDPRYDINDKYFVTPHLLYMAHNKATDLVVAGLLNYNMPENSAKLSVLFAGLSYRDGYNRNNDALNLVFGAEIRQFRIGTAYDLNISELSDATNLRGAFEISITYVAENTLPNTYTVPCDRY